MDVTIRLASPVVRTVTRHRSIGIPPVRPIRHRPALDVEPVVPDVADHADDLVFLVVPGDADVLADGILARPVPQRHGLVDDDAALGIRGILLAEEPSLEERHSHRLQIVVRDHADVGDRLLPSCGLGLPTISIDVAAARPVSGRKLMAPEASTPGSASTCWKRRARNCARWPSPP